VKFNLNYFRDAADKRQMDKQIQIHDRLH